jgi:hypothetical protein
MFTVYFVGQYWLILVQVGYMMQHGVHEGVVHENEEEMELVKYSHHISFITNDGWDIKEKTSFEQVIVATYFALTSLSTVGLGDFYPISDTERLLGSFVLLAGVCMMSYVLSSLRFMIKNIDKLNGEFE